jgi:hypothetical protein
MGTVAALLRSGAGRLAVDLARAERWSVIPFLARLDTAADNPGGIVLEGERDGLTLRWIFSEIGPESFRWRAEETGPDRVAYVRQRFEATRVR